jgi:hypothetical protein
MGITTQYKTDGVQWFARVWFSRQLFCRWTGTQPENPTVSYCQTLCFMLLARQIATIIMKIFKSVHIRIYLSKNETGEFFGFN